MDETDMELIKELWIDSRVSFNHLGKKLGISGNILKKRAERLEKEGVFIMHTNPVFSKFGYARIVFTTEVPRIYHEEFIKVLSKYTEIYDIIFSLSDKCAITTLLPISDEKGVKKEDITNFINKLEAEVSLGEDKFKLKINNIYKLEFYPKENNMNLKPTEKRLIKLLRYDSRLDLNFLSEELGLSKKTLSRYLQKFQERNIITHTIALQPGRIRNFIVNILFITFKEKNPNKIKECSDKVVEIAPNFLSKYILFEPPGLGMYLYSKSLADME
ncbi:MAG: winged helix-turn-helix transcriptional regulator, partial [Promethearchaeota archaeon]